MDNLTLNRIPTKSKYLISVLLTQDDVDLHGLDQRLANKELTLNIHEWIFLLNKSKHWYKTGYDGMRARTVQEIKDIEANHQDRPPRGWRVIIGLEEFIPRVWSKKEKAKPASVSVANTWLCRRAI